MNNYYHNLKEDMQFNEYSDMSKKYEKYIVSKPGHGGSHKFLARTNMDNFSKLSIGK
jgi:hypothetical protein